MVGLRRQWTNGETRGRLMAEDEIEYDLRLPIMNLNVAERCSRAAVGVLRLFHGRVRAVCSRTPVCCLLLEPRQHPPVNNCPGLSDLVFANNPTCAVG